MEKEEYTDKNIEYLEDISSGVNDVKNLMIVLTVLVTILVLVLGGFLFYLSLKGTI